MLTVHHLNNSRSQRLLWLLEELGLPYEIVRYQRQPDMRAPAELRGAAMGLYSLVGFGGGLLGPVVFGAALDIAGGAANAMAWIAAYAAIGAGCLAAPLVARIDRKG